MSEPLERAVDRLNELISHYRQQSRLVGKSGYWSTRAHMDGLREAVSVIREVQREEEADE